MQKNITAVSVLLLLLVLLYYHVEFSYGNVSQIFLSIATFLFAIFAGFFISRQASRYAEIRDRLAEFNGGITAMYRNFSFLNDEANKDAIDVLKKYYNKVLKKRDWDYSFTHKSSIISDFHQLAIRHYGGRKVDAVESTSVNAFHRTASTAQIVRKRIINLRAERMPIGQWVIIYVLASLLLLALSAAISSQGVIIVAILKAAFATSVVFVISLLHSLNNLTLFGDTVGEFSSRDVLEIVKGAR